MLEKIRVSWDFILLAVNEVDAGNTEIFGYLIWGVVHKSSHLEGVFTKNTHFRAVIVTVFSFIFELFFGGQFQSFRGAPWGHAISPVCI